MLLVRFRCPQPRCHRATPAAVHVTHPDQTRPAITHAACQHITPADRAQLAAGRVPERLTVRGER